MILLEIIFGSIITQFLGLNTRYYFFKIFNKNLKKEDFENNQEDIGASFSQGFYNFFIGLIVFFFYLLE
ncbi:hypothetical protein SAMN05421542_1874 [Chryseobacterium jejuense]|uniref:Uncharacterized protein n=1 Tax=Chryseobacterium jejuense TaxID=445960 RepID=A0A2X2VVW2_CHRJE|nr:hypothetical protein SAMN05421542_1874 [Chryseobacterium jejuense]SQB27765.1 Uncharacterised protein [Chryseobacterium jejuense]